MKDLIQIALAFIEGIGLTVSPCILPILPLIFAASSVGGKLRPLQIVLGFILSFTFFSLISRQILLATGIHLDKIQLIAFILILLMGFVMLIPALSVTFAKLTHSIANNAHKISKNRFIEQSGGALLMGALIGIIWTPCAGPVLALALLQVIQSQTNGQALFIILAFSMGTAIPMLIIGYCSHFMSRYLSKVAPHTELIKQSMGFLIIMVALLGIFGVNLGEWVTRYSGREEPIFAQNRLINPIAAPYEAPEITGIQHWINTPPLTLSSLKGKVVLVDFWTYSCINCIRTLRYTEDWYQKYKKNGLVVIGIHSPEFVFEQQFLNVQRAAKAFGLTYPIALDNKLATWRALNNHYWPTHYLINKKGEIVYIHLGEGEYAVMENNIRYLLDLNKESAPSEAVPITSNQTPETYLGNARAQRESYLKVPPLHYWQLEGKWLRHSDYIQNEANDASLTLHYQAKKVFLVIENTNSQPGKIKIITDNGQISEMDIHEAKLYLLLDNDKMKTGIITIKALTTNLRFYAFTFES